MNIVIWFLIIFIFISLAFFIEKSTGDARKKTEHFVDLDFNREEQVIRVYSEVLQRVPTSKEMVENMRSLENNEITIQGLEQKLMDTDEYQRLIKLQSNDLAPELKKMIGDRALIDKVAQLYKEERKEGIPERMRLPMKDIYIHLEYNEFALRAMYRHRNFTPFEEDVLSEEDLDKVKLIAIFNKYFNKEKLFEEGRKIAEQMGILKPSNGSLGDPYAGKGSFGIGPKPNQSACTNVPRNVGDEDSNMDPMLENILKCAGQTFDKDKAARILNGESNWVRFPVRTHYGDMVLREEQAWAVGQPQMPVCTTVGQKPAVQTMLPSSKLLLGTPLGDAAETEVGSIMPKFEYKEYVEVPRGVLNAAYNNTRAAANTATAATAATANAATAATANAATAATAAAANTTSPAPSAAGTASKTT